MTRCRIVKRKKQKLGFGEIVYSEFEMALWAAARMLPVPVMMIAWEPTRWYRGVAVWALTSGLAYSYGYWVREDEDE